MLQQHKMNKNDVSYTFLCQVDQRLIQVENRQQGLNIPQNIFKFLPWQERGKCTLPGTFLDAIDMSGGRFLGSWHAEESNHFQHLTECLAHSHQCYPLGSEGQGRSDSSRGPRAFSQTASLKGGSWCVSLGGTRRVIAAAWYLFAKKRKSN